MYSKYTNHLVDQKSGFDFVAAHFACEKDKYSAENEGGYVNFGSAQNFLSKTSIADRIAAFDWSIDDTPYRQFSGTDSCRGAVAGYLARLAGCVIDPNDVVVGNGMISVLEALSIAILDAGDTILVTTPTFPGLITALTSRTSAQIVQLEADPNDDFQLTPDLVRAHLTELRSSGQDVKAFLLCSPGNPIGQVFSADQIKGFVKLAEEFNIALIVDEIYASSCFEGVDFFSAAALQSNNVFVIGGLSKDFGLAGYTTAWAHTKNENVLLSLKKQSHYFRLAAPIQRAIESFLDPEWQTPFTAGNRNRLTDSYRSIYDGLVSKGVAVTPAEAGLVMWLDFRAYLKTADHAGEFELYRYLLEDHRVHVSPGAGFHFSQNGFFRICFSQQKETLQEGLRRIEQGLLEFQNNNTNHLAEV